MIDRGDAVNLARNLMDESLRVVPTAKGLQTLCDAVLRMDEYIRALRPEEPAIGFAVMTPDGELSGLYAVAPQALPAGFTIEYVYRRRLPQSQRPPEDK